MTVFVDTSALYAVIDSDDDHHAAAAVVWRRLLTDGVRMVTHNYVAVETLALVQARIGMRAVATVTGALIPALDMHMVDAATHELAVSSCVAAGERRISLVDWTSFVVMQGMGIASAFAFDRDFATRGFALIQS